MVAKKIKILIHDVFAFYFVKLDIETNIFLQPELPVNGNMMDWPLQSRQMYLNESLLLQSWFLLTGQIAFKSVHNVRIMLLKGNKKKMQTDLNLTNRLVY